MAQELPVESQVLFEQLARQLRLELAGQVAELRAEVDTLKADKRRSDERLARLEGREHSRQLLFQQLGETAPAGGKVVSVRSDEEFKDLVASRDVVIVDFSASWCGPCKMIAPAFAKLAAAYPSTTLAKLDVDECEAVASAYHVESMPTFMAFVGGEKAGTMSGADESKLKKFVQTHAGGTKRQGNNASEHGHGHGHGHAAEGHHGHGHCEAGCCPSDSGTKMKVTVLSGFLGAGKTTLLKRILRENNKRSDGENLKIAVVVNDMGEINLDADEIKHSKLIQEDAEMVELHNGCICCTLRGDLLKTVKSLSEEQKYDCLVIESTGISEPLPVAQTFVMDVDAAEGEGEGEGEGEAAGDHGHGHAHDGHEHGHGHEHTNSLSNYATLDTMVTVVDALNIFDVLSSLDTLAHDNSVGMAGNTLAEQRLKQPETLSVGDAVEALSGADGYWPAKIAEVHDGGARYTVDWDDGDTRRRDQTAATVRKPLGADEEVDDRGISQLMLDQIEFANVIVRSKLNLSAERLEIHYFR
jgi:thioredoxin